MTTDKLPQAFIEECLLEIELHEHLVEAFRSGFITANEYTAIWKEDSIKI